MKTFSNLALRGKSMSFYKLSKCMAGGGADSAVKGHFKKAPKISDVIIWINVIGPTGMLRRLPGWPQEHLHEVLNKHLTEGFYSHCNGGDMVRRVSDDAFASSSKGVWCGSCHVAISEPWYTQMKPKMLELETTVMDRNNPDTTPNSRLACCIRLKPWMNEMILSICVNTDTDNTEMQDNYIDTSTGGSGKGLRGSMA